jgi:hypothetical protein
MRSPREILFFFFLICLTGGAAATYGGDNPLNATYYGDITGGYLYDMGSSVYEGSIPDGGIYNVTYSFDLPADARVQYQKLYVYWGWSRIGQKAVHPNFTITDSRSPTAPLALVSRYSDTKGFVSQYDFYSGMDAYDMPPLSPGRNAFNVTCVQSGIPNSTVILFGIAVFAVYEHGGFRTYTGTIDRYPDSGETVDLYALVETIPPTATKKAAAEPGIAVLAAAGAALIALAAGRRRT